MGRRASEKIVGDEIVEGNSGVTFQAFGWEARSDTFKSYYDKSPKIEKLAKDNGLTVDEILREIGRRALILKWMQLKGIRNFKELSPLLELYVTRPNDVYNRAVAELEAKGIPVVRISGDAGQ